MTDTDNNNDISEHILNKQVSTLYSLLPVSQAATVINSILLYYIQRPGIDASTARYWLWTLLAIVFLRLSLFVLYQFPKQDYIKRDNKIWKKLFFVTAMISATIWGASGIILFPQNDIHHQVFLVFVIAGMASGSIVVLFPDRKIASLFLIIMMSPVILSFIELPELVSKIMGFMIFVSLISLLILCKSINHQFIENVTLSAEAKLREADLLEHASLLRQTQKLACIGSWQINLSDKQIKLSAQFNGIFDFWVDKKQEIAEAIINAAQKTESFDFTLELAIPGSSRNRLVRIIGAITGHNAQQLSGAIQDISTAESVQLALEHSRQEVLNQRNETRPQNHKTQSSQEQTAQTEPTVKI